MWHVPQIFHRFSVRLSNKFLKIECHHGTKLIKNMNSIVRWGWVWYKKLCRTDRLVLFGLRFIPEVVVFDCLVGIKCVKYCKLFPYRQLSASSPFRELTRDFSGQKLTKWVRIVVFFYGKAFLALDYLYFAMHQEVKERVCEYMYERMNK